MKLFEGDIEIYRSELGKGKKPILKITGDYIPYQHRLTPPHFPIIFSLQ
jgi:hypothetical protein